MLCQSGHLNNSILRKDNSRELSAIAAACVQSCGEWTELKTSLGIVAKIDVFGSLPGFCPWYPSVLRGLYGLRNQVLSDIERVGTRRVDHIPHLGHVLALLSS